MPDEDKDKDKEKSKAWSTGKKVAVGVVGLMIAEPVIALGSRIYNDLQGDTPAEEADFTTQNTNPDSQALSDVQAPVQAQAPPSWMNSANDASKGLDLSGVDAAGTDLGAGAGTGLEGADVGADLSQIPIPF